MVREVRKQNRRMNSDQEEKRRLEERPKNPHSNFDMREEEINKENYGVVIGNIQEIREKENYRETEKTESWVNRIDGIIDTFEESFSKMTRRIFKSGGRREKRTKKITRKIHGR